MKSKTKIALLSSFLILGLLIVGLFDNQEVLIESRESKTKSANPVFNKITLITKEDKDIWMMNQSHYGINARSDKWERLAIVVDKAKSPKVAKFYQVTAGPLVWDGKMKEVPFKVSCFMCHSNGPRAIRANYDSSFDPTTFRDRLKILAWNIKIKSYGRVVAHPSHKIKDKTQVPPFRWRSKYENEVLKVGTCIKCHKNKGFFARGEITRQHLPTIKFMLETGEMPPIGFSLTSNEKIELEKFLKGY